MCLRKRPKGDIEMYYAIKHALKKATSLSRSIDENIFLDELFKGYQSRRTLGFIRELLTPIFEWAKGFAPIASDLEMFKERVAAEMYSKLSNML